MTSPSVPRSQDLPLPDGRLLMDGFSRWILSAVEAVPERVPYVRRQVATVLALWDLDELGWAAELIATELAANVVRHARTLFTVGLFWNGRVLHGEVSDANPVPPVPQNGVGLDQTGGRGLLLVGEIADRWGVERHQRGKTVWFELSPRP